MKRLQNNSIELLTKYLQASKLGQELLPEILDHMACEAEERLWDGNSFEQAFDGIVKAADPETLHFLSVETKHLLAMENSLNDIVFENRNKLYGAYALRKDYKKTIQRSVLIGVSLFLFMILLPNLYASLKPEGKDTDIAYEVEVKPIDIKFYEAPKPQIKSQPPPVANTVRSRTVMVVPDEQVVNEQVPPTVDELESAQSGQETVAGTGDVDLIVPPVENVSASLPVEIKSVPEKEFLIVEQSPEYLGGNASLSNFLQKNLKYPQQALHANIQGRVFVQFTVGSDGKITDVHTLKGIGFGCDEEAVRVMKLMPDWVPGRQGGKAVRVRFTMPIVFQLD